MLEDTLYVPCSRAYETARHNREVEACLTNPDKVIEGKGFKFVKKLDDKALIVVYRMEADAIIVITAYCTSKLHKYL